MISISTIAFHRLRVRECVQPSIGAHALHVRALRVGGDMRRLTWQVSFSHAGDHNAGAVAGGSLVARVLGNQLFFFFFFNIMC